MTVAGGRGRMVKRPAKLYAWRCPDQPSTAVWYQRRLAPLGGSGERSIRAIADQDRNYLWIVPPCCLFGPRRAFECINLICATSPRTILSTRATASAIEHSRRSKLGGCELRDRAERRARRTRRGRPSRCRACLSFVSGDPVSQRSERALDRKSRFAAAASSPPGEPGRRLPLRRAADPEQQPGQPDPGRRGG